MISLVKLFFKVALKFHFFNCDRGTLTLNSCVQTGKSIAKEQKKCVSREHAVTKKSCKVQDLEGDSKLVLNAKK